MRSKMLGGHWYPSCRYRKNEKDPLRRSIFASLDPKNLTSSVRAIGTLFILTESNEKHISERGVYGQSMQNDPIYGGVMEVYIICSPTPQPERVLGD